MTEETRKLFDAPWKSVEDKDNPFPFMHHKEIVTNNGQGHTIANDIIGDDANRIARLPELYDELERMVNVECVNACERHGPCDKPCDVVKPAIELLKKVRNGE